MQIFSNDKTVRSDTIQGLKEFKQQSQTTQVKKREQVVSMMPAFKKASDLLGNDIVNLSVKNDFLKKRIGSYNQKWLEESQAKLLKQRSMMKKEQI